MPDTIDQCDICDDVGDDVEDHVDPISGSIRTLCDECWLKRLDEV